MINIQFLESALIPETDALDAQLRQAAQAVIAQSGIEAEVELTVVISDDAHLQELNRSYRGINAPTDVLSFPIHAQDPDTGALYLGDIVISYLRAERQARQNGHALEEELRLLVVHGGLHLLGHDHALESERSAMWRLQDQTLADLGSSIRSPHD